MDLNTTESPYKDELLVLSLGTNLGDRFSNLLRAREELSVHFGEPAMESRIYDTAPWGKSDQPGFLNQILVFDVGLRPMMVLDTILRIEKELGRIRREKWGPRIIDIDVIFYGDLIFEGDDLRIPHPHMAERAFVLEPLLEVLPDFRHPLQDKTIRELWNALESVK
ncbi:MAG: 2-amino-4-hydroxy-6-hydroxymethyldihydropteridine diphosphokinase [Flavobacteriales bacterium]|nr:2-amino-4-hydroxy-6-hydroxymethyldihydropteridine diphosphokinase [Flavobacteriales bacterium]